MQCAHEYAIFRDSGFPNPTRACDPIYIIKLADAQRSIPGLPDSMNSFPESALYGINAVLEAIQSQQRACYKLVVDQEASRSRRLREIITLAQSQEYASKHCPRLISTSNFAAYRTRALSDLWRKNGSVGGGTHRQGL